MTRLVVHRDPVGLVLAEAERFAKVQEDPAGSNRSVEIDYWLASLGLGFGLPWCAAAVTAIGIQALGRAGWPVTPSARVKDLAAWGKDLGLLKDTPTRGDLFLIYYADLDGGRFGHVGFVTEVARDGIFSTWEGNTIPDGVKPKPGEERNGYRVAKKVRRVGPRYKFVAWEAALAAAVSP